MGSLTSENVTETFDYARDDNGDLETDILGKEVRFNKARLEEKRELVGEMLLDLPEGFRRTSGGGWSFLQACDTKDGTQWTGLHAFMAQLFAMGRALGLVDYALPQHMWEVLPGGMPYMIVNDNKIEHNDLS